MISCSSDLIRNPNVERWCGDKPCDWQVEGEVERVGTWHPNDYAVSLLGDDVSLIQENATVDYRDSDCFSFAMVAKIASGVKVFLELDFLADGSVEFSQQFPRSDWDRRTFRVSAPDWYNKVRFIIRKEGPGLAILAEISAKNANGECSAPPVELLERPEGALCASADECADGAACRSGRCGGCEGDSACGTAQVCALQDIDHARYNTCVDRASTPLGAACDRNEQCKTGLCAAGACSECGSDAECQEGVACNDAVGRPGNSRYWPKLCGAGELSRQTGDACTHDRDCESSDCEGYEASCDANFPCVAGDPPCFTCGPQLQLGTCR